MEPGGAVVTGDHPLGPEDIAVILSQCQGGQGLLKLLTAVFPGGLPAPGGKHLVGVVVMVMVVVAAAGGAGVAMLMMMVMVVFMVVLMLAVAVLMVAVRVVMAVVLVVMPVMMVLMVVMVVLDLLHQLVGQVLPALHGGEDLRPGELVPGGGEDGGLGVLLPQQSDGSVQLVLIDLLSAGQDDGAGVLHLVVEELAEVFHIDLGLGGVHHGDKAVQVQVGALRLHPLHSGHHVGQLAHPGGLDHDAVGGVVGQHLLQGRAEIPHQGAADTARIHLGNLHPGVLQKAAVNADLAELVLNKDELLPLKALVQQLFDQSGLSGP